ncbi:MAG: hypothetical protein WEA99_03130 [Brumimicrobium sp.]
MILSFDFYKYLQVFILLVFTSVVTSCGPSRFVEPLNKSENAVSVSLGGPLANIPGVATIPMPFTSIGYGRGVTDNITAFGSWYSTAAVFGVVQFDAGATVGLWKSKNKKHGFSGTGGFNFATDRFEWNTSFWPQLDANYYWKYNHRSQTQDDLLTKGGVPKSNLLYAGIGTWYELKGIRAHDVEQPTRVVPMLNIGHDLNWNKWTMKLEVKLLAPFTSNEDVVVDYVSLMGNQGATGVYLGFTRRF